MLSTIPKGSFLNLTTVLTIILATTTNTIGFSIPSAHAASISSTTFPVSTSSTISPTPNTTTLDSEENTRIRLECSIWYPFWELGSSNTSLPWNDEKYSSNAIYDDDEQQQEDPEEQRIHVFLQSVISSVQEFLAHDVELSNYTIAVQDHLVARNATPDKNDNDERIDTEVPTTSTPSKMNGTNSIVVRMSDNVFAEEGTSRPTTPSTDSVSVVTLALESLSIQGHVSQQNKNLRWSVWSFSYRIVSVGSLEEAIGTATKPTIFDEAVASHQISCIVSMTSTLQNLLQESLNENIQTGQLDLQLQENFGSTVPLASVVGTEQASFETAWKDFVSQYYAWIKRAAQLRILGVVMIFFDIVVLLAFTYLSKRRREARRKYLATSFPGGESTSAQYYDLTTENGVNEMLLIGKQQSRMAMARNLVV